MAEELMQAAHTVVRSLPIRRQFRVMGGARMAHDSDLQQRGGCLLGLVKTKLLNIWKVSGRQVAI